jgi:hypothetical protein
MGISWPTLLIGFAGQVLIALLTVRLAVGTFRQQKLWERRLDAYTSIIRDFHHVKRDADLNFDAEIEGQPLSEETKAALWASVQSAQADLALHSDIGELLLSAAALASIRKTVSAIAANHPTTYQEFLDNSYGITNTGLNEFREIARGDLGAYERGPLKRLWVRRPWARPAEALP